MTLFDITKKNIKNNFKNYFLYFCSMVFGILMFYIFISTQSNKDVLNAVSTKVSFILNFGGITTAIFCAVFIWYSNSFFIRGRKKEIAFYSLLGVKKKQIGRMLFYENMTMGGIALFIGVLLGSLFSKLFAMILLRLMGSSMSVSFSISMVAILKTILVFGLIFLIISIHSYFIIYRFKLIELFKANNISEKEPKQSLVLSFLGIGLLIFGYYYSANIDYIKDFFIYAFIVITSVIIGTFLFFRFFMIFLIKILKSNKKKYYRGVNLITISNLLYKIKSNAVMLSIVSLLCATTLTFAGTFYGIYYNVYEQARGYNPFDYTYTVSKEIDNNKVSEALEEYKEKNPTKMDLYMPYINIFTKLNIKLYLPETYKVSIVSINDLNKIDDLFVLNKLPSLKKDEVIVLANPNVYEYRKETISKLSDVDYFLDNKTYKLKVKLVEKKLLFADSFYPYNLVVSDELFKEIKVKIKDNKILEYDKLKEDVENQVRNWDLKGDDEEDIKYLIEEEYKDAKNNLGYNIKRIIDIQNEKDSKELTKKLNDITNKKIQSFYYPYSRLIEDVGMILFVFGFLGVIVLVSTGSIIYFKLLTKANDDKNIFIVLSKIGVSKKDRRKIIKKEIRFLFLIPLLMGVLHCGFALNALSLLIGMNLFKPTLITIISYLAIYSLYYCITVYSYEKIIYNDLL
ncbi:ABC transporter permease [Peptostreptococcaceae bacterium AGR-M142]